MDRLNKRKDSGYLKRNRSRERSPIRDRTPEKKFKKKHYFDESDYKSDRRRKRSLSPVHWLCLNVKILDDYYRDSLG